VESHQLIGWAATKPKTCSTSGHHVHGTFRAATATTSGIGTSVLASSVPLDVTADLNGITTLVVDAPGGASTFDRRLDWTCAPA
jgi:hypothetical protein